MGDHADDAVNRAFDSMGEDDYGDPFDLEDIVTSAARREGPKVGDNCPSRGCKGGKIVLRKNKYTGVEFLGCDQYPKCKYNSSIEEDISRSEFDPRG